MTESTLIFSSAEKTLNFRKENEVKLQYASRISQNLWQLYEGDIRSMHIRGMTRQALLRELGMQFSFCPSLGQLNAQMKMWGLHVYRLKQTDGGNRIENSISPAIQDSHAEKMESETITTHTEDCSDVAHTECTKSAPLALDELVSVSKTSQPHITQQPEPESSLTSLGTFPAQFTSFRSIDNVLVPKLPKTKREVSPYWMCSDLDCFKSYGPYELRARWIDLGKSQRQALEERWVAKIAHDGHESLGKAFEDFCNAERYWISYNADLGLQHSRSGDLNQRGAMKDSLQDQSPDDGRLFVEECGPECIRRINFSTFTMFQLFRVPPATESATTDGHSREGTNSSSLSSQGGELTHRYWQLTKYRDPSRQQKHPKATSKRLCARTDAGENTMEEHTTMPTIGEDGFGEVLAPLIARQTLVPFADDTPSLRTFNGPHLSDRESDTGSMRSFKSLAVRLKRKNAPGYLSSSSGGMSTGTDTDVSGEFHRVSGIPSANTGRGPYLWSDEEEGNDREDG